MSETGRPVSRERVMVPFRRPTAASSSVRKRTAMPSSTSRPSASRSAVSENIRTLSMPVKRTLRRQGYSPHKPVKATQRLLEQPEVLSQEWAVA